MLTQKESHEAALDGRRRMEVELDKAAADAFLSGERDGYIRKERELDEDIKKKKANKDYIRAAKILKAMKSMKAMKGPKAMKALKAMKA